MGNQHLIPKSILFIISGVWSKYIMDQIGPQDRPLKYVSLLRGGGDSLKSVQQDLLLWTPNAQKAKMSEGLQEEKQESV